jgi:hypothetical protein
LALIEDDLNLNPSLMGIQQGFGNGSFLDFEGYTYLSAAEPCFKSRIFPIEIIRPDKYMKTKSKHFG